jgi:hypothetical protein
MMPEKRPEKLRKYREGGKILLKKMFARSITLNELNG